MNIKNRLFISNILMITIPFVFISLVVTGLMLIFSGIVNSHGFFSFFSYARSLKALEVCRANWEQHNNIELLFLDVDAFNIKYGSDTKKLYVFRDGNAIYPDENTKELFSLFSQHDGNGIVIVDKTAMIKRSLGDYDIVLLDTDYSMFKMHNYAGYDDIFLNYGILTVMCIIIIIFITNRFLIGFVFNTIETSIDSLTYGVKQIRDGNLRYRIKYDKKDEFAQICSDFNEMASRLLEFVNASQKDESNRRELIAGISHNLRTPLTSIKAYVEGIEKGVASTPEAQKHYLGIIQRKTDDLTHLVNQLFMFSKLDIGEFPFKIEVLDIGVELSRLIGEAAEEYSAKGLLINLKENLCDTYVAADIVQLRNVFINILENALKYKNKNIGEVCVVCKKSNSNVTIIFSDDGPGVRDDEIEKIFDVFYQSDQSQRNTYKGSGLGLAITAKILERLGGTIKAENRLSGGLAIIITLPETSYPFA